MNNLSLALPVVQVAAENLPRAWEEAVIRTWREGAVVATQYDKPRDPPSRDALAIISVADPFAEPRIHKAIPGGITELEVYRQEVVEGIRDHWIDPEEGKWEYTYHQRLFDYAVEGVSPRTTFMSADEKHINQIDYIVETLAAAPYSRRALAITWKPWEDAGISDPACLQLVWCRVFDDRLVMNIHIRSNDAFKAGFMNMYAFTDLQRLIAERLSDELVREIKVGQYNHIADSFHIYGSYFEEFERFLESTRKRSFEERTFRTEEVQEIIDEAREQIAASLEAERTTGRKGL